MKNVILSLSIAVAITVIIIIINMIPPPHPGKELQNRTENFTIHASQIFNSEINGFASKPYNPEEYVRVNIKIEDYKKDENIKFEEATELKRMLNNEYSQVLMDTIKIFIQRKVTERGLKEMLNELNKLSGLSEINQQLKNNTIKLSLEFTSSLHYIDYLDNVIFKEMYDEDQALMYKNLLGKVFVTDLLKENTELITKTNVVLNDLENFSYVDSTYKDLLNICSVPENCHLPSRPNEMLASNNGSSRVFMRYVEKFKELREIEEKQNGN